MSKKTKDADNKQEGTSWKKRPSEISGFQNTFYLTDAKNDYVRIDYNLKEKRVRLYVEVFQEGGSPYFSIINKGKITVEKNVFSGRSYGFSEVFSNKADVFSTVPDNDVMTLIIGNYGITSPVSKSGQKLNERETRLAETRRKYFLRSDERDNPYLADSKKGKYASLRPMIGEIVDMLVGAIISLGLFFILEYNFIAMGIFAAFYGIVIGVIDLFIRETRPHLVKVLFFFAAGITSYIYGYYVI
jgi:hypothetical protein